MNIKALRIVIEGVTVGAELHEKALANPLHQFQKVSRDFSKILINN